MKIATFDKIAWTAIISAFLFTAIAATSWNWFSTPCDWGDIARIPKSIKNYIALLSPPLTMLACLIIRRRYFNKEHKGIEDKEKKMPANKSL